MEKYIEKKMIFKKIKEEIYKLYPVLEPRVIRNKNESGYNSNELGINFYFYDIDDSICAQICFFKDNGLGFKYCLVDDDFADEVIGNLIRFLLIEFPYVNNLNTCSNGFKMEFGIGVEQHGNRGISCSKVNVSFDTHPDLISRFSSLFSYYLEYIMFTFQEEISKNPECSKGYYRGYYDMLKPMMIKNLTSDELKKIINLLTDEEIKKLLLGISDSRFFELTDSFYNKDKKGMVRELKKVNFSGNK